MSTLEVNDLFNVEYGNLFDANKMIFDPNTDINFISRTSKNNGCVGSVKMYKNTEPYPEGLITVSLGGSFLLSSFVQPKPFYTAQNVAVLTPKQKMTLSEKLFYCSCLPMNRFRYCAFGREANRTLKTIKIPSKIPSWVYDVSYELYNLKTPLNKNKPKLTDRNWKCFSYPDIFDIKKGYYNKTPKNEGTIPFISATRENNGISFYCDKSVLDVTIEGNCLTVVNNGSSMGETFYQSEGSLYGVKHDVNVLRLKNQKLNVYIAMFLIPLIKMDKIRFHFGRKWRIKRMKKSKINLPVNKKGQPDWEFMENYIKSLRFSKKLS